MESYFDNINFIAGNGVNSMDRTGTGTYRSKCLVNTYDLAGGKIPLLTTKKVMLSSVIKELVWFIKGETNISTLGCGIWNEWADENGELGPIYGKQWRFWEDTKIISKDDWEANYENYTNLGYMDTMADETRVVITRKVDQLQNAVDALKLNPDSRRIIVSAWNVGDLEKMALVPCHSFYQFLSTEMTVERRIEHYVQKLRAGATIGFEKDICFNMEDEDSCHIKLDELGVSRRELTINLYQRSGDMFLGVPFNIASYSLMCLFIAHLTGHEPGYLNHIIGDAHIYHNHIDQVSEQQSRHIIHNDVYFEISPHLEILDEVSEAAFIQCTPYIHHPTIKAPVAV